MILLGRLCQCHHASNPAVSAAVRVACLSASRASPGPHRPSPGPTQQGPPPSSAFPSQKINSFFFSPWLCLSAAPRGCVHPLPVGTQSRHLAPPSGEFPSLVNLLFHFCSSDFVKVVWPSLHVVCWRATVCWLVTLSPFPQFSVHSLSEPSLLPAHVAGVISAGEWVCV